jgi:hypothetical protein
MKTRLREESRAVMKDSPTMCSPDHLHLSGLSEPFLRSATPEVADGVMPEDLTMNAEAIEYAEARG